MPPKSAKPPPAAEFEYCELCHYHHDQGRRHCYGIKHLKKLRAALTSFRSKLSDLRRAFLHGSPSSQPPRARLWCPFCSTDLVDLDSRSAGSNGIYHLASSEHLKGVKDFLRKHGGGMDQVDSLRISDGVLAKWEKGLESLSTGTKMETEGLIGPSLKQIKAMGHMTLLVQRLMELPVLEVLLILLHMELLDCPSHLGDRPKHISSRVHCLQTCFTAVVLKQKILPLEVQQSHTGGSLSNGSKANVHSGAPPWLKANEHDPNNLPLRSCALPSRKGKLRKLNPKRVGAAWAERRRAEIELEKQGEFVPATSDSSWLPNFGGVWQSGTGKESRKDFEKSHKRHDIKNNHDLSLEIKPYISKRMRVGADKVSDKAEELGSHLQQ